MSDRAIPSEIVSGSEVSGRILRLDEPLSFYGGFDPETGRISERRHPQFGLLLSGKIVLMHSGRGSSSSSSILLEAVRLGTSPAALVLEVCDAILAVGAAAAEELYGRGPTVARVGELPDIADGTDAVVVENRSDKRNHDIAKQEIDNEFSDS